MRSQGIAVAPSAVQGEGDGGGGQPPQQQAQDNAGQVSAEEQAELAAAGLAPEPQQTTPTQPTGPEPSKPAFTPVKGESEAVTAVRKLCFESNVTEEQVMKFMQVNKLSAGEVKLTDFTVNSRENKLVAMARTWNVILPRIKAQ